MKNKIINFSTYEFMPRFEESGTITISVLKDKHIECPIFYVQSDYTDLTPIMDYLNKCLENYKTT